MLIVCKTTVGSSLFPQALDGLLHIIGNRSFNMKLFFRAGMGEAQGCGVQGLPSDQLRAGGTVENVRYHRVSDVGHMDPDLMGTASLQLQSHQGISHVAA